MTEHPDPAALLRSRSYLGLLVIAALLGVPISAAAYGFLALVSYLESELFTHLPHGLGYASAPVWWPLPVLLVGAALVAVFIGTLPGGGGPSPAGGFKLHKAPNAAQLPGLVALMRRESALEGLGGRAMLNALSTALFALTLRVASESHEAPSGVLALAAHPRLAPALTALFQEPARAWTLPQLARLCHLSRATFARQFQERLGRSASDLLTDIRMTLAANELRKS